jgi:short-subunit dehydrogenase
MNLENKIILITGSNGGLGRELVKSLLKENVNKIYCAVRDIKDAKSLQDLSTKIELLKMDISDIENVESSTLNIKNIDLLINNAGVNSGKRIFDNSTLDFDVNVMGTLNVTKILSSKLNKNGTIINITSVLALSNYPILGLYSASKSALHSLTQAMRAEMSSRNINVLEILPGPIDTNMTKGVDMPKASTLDIVNEILIGLKNKVNEVYPDDFSKMIKNNLEKDSKSVEVEFMKSLS